MNYSLSSASPAINTSLPVIAASQEADSQSDLIARQEAVVKMFLLTVGIVFLITVLMILVVRILECIRVCIRRRLGRQLNTEWNGKHGLRSEPDRKYTEDVPDEELEEHRVTDRDHSAEETLESVLQ